MASTLYTLPQLQELSYEEIRQIALRKKLPMMNSYTSKGRIIDALLTQQADFIKAYNTQWENFGEDMVDQDYDGSKYNQQQYNEQYLGLQDEDEDEEQYIVDQDQDQNEDKDEDEDEVQYIVDEDEQIDDEENQNNNEREQVVRSDDEIQDDEKLSTSNVTDNMQQLTVTDSSNTVILSNAPIISRLREFYDTKLSIISELLKLSDASLYNIVTELGDALEIKGAYISINEVEIADKIALIWYIVAVKAI